MESGVVRWLTPSLGTVSNLNKKWSLDLIDVMTNNGEAVAKMKFGEHLQQMFAHILADVLDFFII